MTATFFVFAGIALGILALAVLLIGLALLVKALAALLPPASQFLGDVQSLREWSARRAASARPAGAQTTDGIAPGPVFEPEAERSAARPGPFADGPTSADLPPVVIGDVDRFDEAAAEEFVARPLAAGSRHAARPPGEPIEGER